MLPVACMLLESAASPDWVLPLVTAFSPLVHLCPLPGPGAEEAGLRRLAEKGRLLALSPALADADAARLRAFAGALASEEKVRHGESLRQMLAELLTLPGSSIETQRELLQRLRQGADGEAGAENGIAAAPGLLRERVRLLLAAQAQREQEALRAGLARISRRQQRMLQDMGQDGRQDDHSAPEPLPLAPLRAWAGLLAHCSLPCPNPWFITQNPIIADALLAACREAGGAPMALPGLLLPATAGSDTAGPELLQQQCPELLNGLAALQDAAGEDVQRLADACAESLRHSEARPKEGPGALCRLRLFVLPQTSLALLLAGLTAGERSGLQPQTRPCLLGLLEKAGQAAGG